MPSFIKRAICSYLFRVRICAAAMAAKWGIGVYKGKRSRPAAAGEVMARAIVRGCEGCPSLRGSVTFRNVKNGVLVSAEVYGLPENGGKCKGGIFGFHIHEGTSCGGNEKDCFADAKAHYNPDGCPHPYHAGDLPPLFSNGGYAYMSVFTERFKIKDVCGRVVVIHSKPDDFTTQPSGDSGEKIACGKIERVWK